MSKLFQKLNSLSNLKTECLSGLTVALALVPEAIAFAFVAHVHPLVGLYAAFIVCLITSVFGGRPGMISGATGALAVVMASLVINHGVEYLFATVVLMGIIQIGVGLMNLGRFIKLIPHPVMLGFVNGLAIVIFLAQLGQFKTVSGNSEYAWMQGTELYIMLALVAVTMAIIHFLPKITKAIPSALAAILLIFGITQLLGIDTKSVGDMASIAGGLPSFHIPVVPVNWETIQIILPYAVTLAGVGLLESLLALVLIDEITETRGDNARECMTQGLANVVTGFSGGMGGCAMIGQSMINIGAGARKRLSGIVAAVSLLGFILFGSAIIEKIPLASLVGVMFMVVIGTFAWSSIRIMNKIPRVDAIVVVLVSGMTVAFDLAIAVFAGVILSALTYCWKSAKQIFVKTSFNDDKSVKIYNITGPLFFGSITTFKGLFDISSDPQAVVINFESSKIWDHSALQAIETLIDKYHKANKDIKITGIQEDCAKILRKAGYETALDCKVTQKFNLLIKPSFT
ncbi:MAG: SulP family inorganic anion transporter [Alphaproteobacteria bacterium]